VNLLAGETCGDKIPFTKLANARRIWLLALAVALLASTASAHAGTQYVDGISDQSMPAWDGSFASSGFASAFRSRWLGQIAIARYVVQWNVMSELSAGANAQGDYRERFEAWLEDVGSLGLAPVLALTSYDGVYPSSAGEYQPRLEQLLAQANRDGEHVDYVEAWNEPNDQGDESAAKAGEIADWAHTVCERGDCQVIAGDLEDSPSAAQYEQDYSAALTFAPRIWGIHPYRSVYEHSDAPVLDLLAALPDRGAGAQIWFTEVGAYYCLDGRVRGESQQAGDAAYLTDTLMPAIAPEHVFYYGFMAADDAEVPCTVGSAGDSELYGAFDRPRAAAAVILDPVAEPRLLFTSRLGQEQLAYAFR
jgi:hypothetical protein